MLFSNRSRRSSVPEVASDSDPKPHPADLQFGALPDIPDEVVQFDDEDRYALDDSDSSPTEDRDHVPDNAFVTENKLWLALQNRSSSRRRSSTTSTLQSASSIGSSCSGSALALGPEEDAPFSY